MPIAETIIGSVVKSASDGLSRLLIEGHGDKLRIDDSRATECLLDHLATVDKWSSTVSMLNLRRSKRLQEAYVEMSLDVGFLRYIEDADETETMARNLERSIAITELLRSTTGHVAILGRPGAGKTTSLQRLAQLALRDREAGKRGVPILIMLRDLRDGEGIVEHLLAKLGISVRVGVSDSAPLRRVWEQRALHRYLDRVSALLLVDGLDEADPVSRRVVENELRDIALAKGNHRLFLTCRTAEYNLDLRGVQPYTIRPLTREKIVRFATQWLGEERGIELVEAIRNNPYAGTEVVPLTLGHLCALYERDGSLPKRPIDVYEAIVSLLIEDWDRQRGVRRVSQYADFSPRKKERFLQAVAFELTMAGRKGAFRHDDLRRVYERVSASFELPHEAEESVVLELESHTGIIYQTGYRRYQYVHLVIQEFLCAMHAQRTPNGIQFLVPSFPNEMALIVAYSTSAESYLEEVFRLFEPLAETEFVKTFVTRIGVEGVDVIPSIRTGWVLLAYLDWMSAHRVLPVGVYYDYYEVRRDLQSFFLRPGAVAAIESALAQARVQMESKGVRIIVPAGSDVPSFLSEREHGLFVGNSSRLTQLLPPKYIL